MTCPDCHGHGHTYSDNGPAPRLSICEWCNGSGATVTALACVQCDAPRGTENTYCVDCEEVTGSYPFVAVMGFERSACGFVHLGEGL